MSPRRLLPNRQVLLQLLARARPHVPAHEHDLARAIDYALGIIPRPRPPRESLHEPSAAVTALATVQPALRRGRDAELLLIRIKSEDWAISPQTREAIDELLRSL